MFEKILEVAVITTVAFGFLGFAKPGKETADRVVRLVAMFAVFKIMGDEENDNRPPPPKFGNPPAAAAA